MISYVFIDGAYFQKAFEATKTAYNMPTFELNYQQMFGGFDKTFYYDCLPPRLNNETDNEYNIRMRPVAQLFKSLRALPGFHVYQGSTVGVGGSARQKGVDVQLAVHMFAHAVRKNAERFTLLAGDGDFYPLVEALVMEGVYTTVWYTPRRASDKLLDAADHRVALKAQSLFSAATNVCRVNLVFPQASVGPYANLEYPLLAQGRLQNGDRVILHGNINNVSVQCERQDDNWLRVDFHDRNVAILYMEELIEATITWE